MCRFVRGGVRGYMSCFGHEQLSRRAPSAHSPCTAPWFGRALSPGCSRGAPPGHVCLQRCHLGDPILVPGRGHGCGGHQHGGCALGASKANPRGEPGNRRQLRVPTGMAARTLAGLLPGPWLGYCQAWGVQAALGAEEQCTLCPPKILASQERGMGIPKLSLLGVFEGLWGDADLKSSFAEHPWWSLPSGVQLSPVLGRPSWSSAPGSRLG